jgi:hypothetical protein
MKTAAAEGIAAALARYDAAWQSEAECEAPAQPVPDGKYAAVVDNVDLTESSNGNPMLKWTLRITSGEFAGRTLWKNAAITGNSLKFIKRELGICGLELDAVSKLPDNLGALLEVNLEVIKRSRGGYYDVFFNRRVDGAPVADDDLPF